MARALIDRTLPSWGCDALVEDARLVVTELVTNAIRHAGTTIEVWLELRQGSMHIAVTDHASGTVGVRSSEPSSDEQEGRGLRIVAAVSDRWGVTQTEHGEGKVVWAELELSR